VNSKGIVIENDIADDRERHVLTRAVNVAPYALIVVVDPRSGDGERTIDAAFDRAGETVLILTVESVAAVIDFGLGDDKAVTRRADALGVRMMNTNTSEPPRRAWFHRLSAGG
jgi:hypothetical protein